MGLTAADFVVQTSSKICIKVSETGDYFPIVVAVNVDVVACSTPCNSEGGLCVYGDIEGAVCKCFCGFSGNDCGSGCPNSCSDGGTCVDFNTCACNADRHGDDCSSVLCPVNDAGITCSRQGKCLSDGTCNCYSQYEGDACESLVITNSVSVDGGSAGFGTLTAVEVPPTINFAGLVELPPTFEPTANPTLEPTTSMPTLEPTASPTAAPFILTMSVSLSFVEPLTEEAQTDVCSAVSGNVAGPSGVSAEFITCAMTLASESSSARRLLAVAYDYDTEITISIPVTETTEEGGSAVESILDSVADTSDLAVAIASNPDIAAANGGVPPTVAVAPVELIVSDCNDALFADFDCTEATSNPTAVPTAAPTATPTAVPTTTPTATPPTPAPTSTPIPAPTSTPIPAPTSAPTTAPTPAEVPNEEVEPTLEPTPYADQVQSAASSNMGIANLLKMSLMYGACMAIYSLFLGGCDF